MSVTSYKNHGRQHRAALLIPTRNRGKEHAILDGYKEKMKSRGGDTIGRKKVRNRKNIMQGLRGLKGRHLRQQTDKGAQYFTKICFQWV